MTHKEAKHENHLVPIKSGTTHAYGVESLNLKLVFYRSYHLRGQIGLDRGKIIPEVDKQNMKIIHFQSILE